MKQRVATQATSPGNGQPADEGEGGGAAGAGSRGNRRPAAGATGGRGNGQRAAEATGNGAGGGNPGARLMGAPLPVAADFPPACADWATGGAGVCLDSPRWSGMRRCWRN